LVSAICFYIKEEAIFRNSSKGRGKRLEETSKETKMTDFIYHAMGFCGEHWHPNAINITAMIMIATLILKSIKNKYEKA